MKILLVSQNFAPELTGIGKYSGEMADGLVDRGHEVTVVCAPAYYPQWRVEGPNRYRVETPRSGLRVVRCPVWMPGRLGAVRRMLHLLSFAAASAPVVLREALRRPDVVMGVAPSLATAPGAWLAAKLAGARSWLHVQDFEFDAALGLGVLRGPALVHRLLRAAESRLMRGFDRVSTISPRMAERLLAKGVEASRIESLPNWVDLGQIHPLPAPVALRDELTGASERTVLLFSGTMNRKQGLDLLIDAFDGIDPAVAAGMLLVLCGDGELRPRLQERCAGRANIRLLPLQPPDRLNELLNAADVHLLPQLAGAADLVMPSKLGAMMASGRPVIATAAAQTQIASVVHGCGWVVPPGDADALRQAMVQAHADRSARLRFGAAAREHALRNLDRQQLIGQLSQRLQQQAPAGRVVASPTMAREGASDAPTR